MHRIKSRVIALPFIPIMLLLILGCITYLPGIAPILYSDDWQLYVRQFAFSGLKWVDWSDRRPLVYTGFKLLQNLFGLHLNWVYYSSVLIIILTAVAVFFLVRRVFPRYPVLALPVAVLFLIYPVDQTRMWLTQNYTWAIFLVTLVGMLLLFDFARQGRVWQLLVALLLVILPLGAYEAQLGLILAGSALMALLIPRIPLSRRLLTALPILLGILFIVWRAYIQPTMLNIHDMGLKNFQLTPAFLLEMVRRWLQAFPVFITCWVQPFSFLLGVTIPRLLVLLAGVVASCMLLAFWFSHETQSKSAEEQVDEQALLNPAGQALIWADKKSEALGLLSALATGVVLLLAGYFPAIVLFGPSLVLETSRLNLFAILGGALALGSALALVSLLIAQNRVQMRMILIAALIPLLMAGMTQQIWNQYEAKRAWAEQKHFWKAMFQTIPNLQDGTTVIVVTPHNPDQRPFRRFPISSEWELTSAMQVLYHNPTLVSAPYVPDHHDRFGYADLRPDGFHSLDYGVIPYQNIIFVFYVPGSYEVRLMDHPDEEIPLPFPLAHYRPGPKIQPPQPGINLNRFLVLN